MPKIHTDEPTKGVREYPTLGYIYCIMILVIYYQAPIHEYVININEQVRVVVLYKYAME